MLGLASRCCVYTTYVTTRVYTMYVYTLGNKLRVPRKLKCHQCWVTRGSCTSARPRVWLGPVGVPCQALEARKNSVGRRKVAQVAIGRRSEHHTVFIGCQHQRFPHYCLGQGIGVTLSLKNATVSFAACPLCGFPTCNLLLYVCTVWPELLAGNLFRRIGGFESNPPIFHPPKNFTVWCHHYCKIIAFMCS